MAKKSSYSVEVLIAAVDKITAPLSKITSAIQNSNNKVGGAIKAGQGWTKAFAETSGFARIAKQAGVVGEKAGHLSETMKGLAGNFAGVGIGVALLGQMAHQTSETADHVAKMSTQLDLSKKKYQEFAFAARMADIGTEDFDSAMTKFGKNIVDAAKGTGDAKNVFRALGVQITDKTGKLRSMADLFPEVAEKLKNVSNGNIRTSATMAIFGKGAAKMTELMSEGSAGLEEASKKAYELNAILSDDAVESGKKFDTSFKEIRETLIGVRNVIGSQLLPVMVPMLQKVGQFLQENGPQIGEFAKSVIEGFMSMAKAVWIAAQPIVWFFTTYDKATGSLKLNTDTIMLVFQGLAAFMAGKMVLAIASLASSIVSFGAVLLASPITWYVGIVAGLAYVAYKVYQNWDKIKELFSTLWDVIKENPFAAMIPIFGPLIALGKALYRTFEPIRNLFDSVAGYTSKLFGFTGPQAPELNSGGLMQEAVAAKNQRVDMSVNFANAPAGTRLQSNSTTGVNLESYLGIAMGGT